MGSRIPRRQPRAGSHVGTGDPLRALPNFPAHLSSLPAVFPPSTYHEVSLSIYLNVYWFNTGVANSNAWWGQVGWVSGDLGEKGVKGWGEGRGMWAPGYGVAATQCQLFFATGESGTRAAGSSAFSRGRLTPDCYLHFPDFGKTLWAKQNTSVDCMGPQRWRVCDPWLTAALLDKLAAFCVQAFASSLLTWTPAPCPGE